MPTHLLKSTPEILTSQNLPEIAALQLSEATTSRALIQPVPVTPRSASIFPPSRFEEKQQLKVFFEVGMKQSVVRDDGEETIEVSGFADYSLGHGDDKTSGNFIIMKAKKPSKLSEIPSQCLAYMG